MPDSVDVRPVYGRIYVVVLEKAEAVLGPAPADTEARLVSRNGWADEDEARGKAYRILKRDRPDENPMCWRVKEMLSE